MPKAGSNPYRNLWLAVINQAIEDLLCDSKNQSKAKQEKIEFHRRKAAFWLLEDQSKKIGSLYWICNHFDLCFEKIRKSIKEGSFNACSV